jgi:hypothetical protein
MANINKHCGDIKILRQEQNEYKKCSQDNKKNSTTLFSCCKSSNEKQIEYMKAFILNIYKL